MKLPYLTEKDREAIRQALTEEEWDELVQAALKILEQETVNCPKGRDVLLMFTDRLSQVFGPSLKVQ